jgi:hypothetical protein
MSTKCAQNVISFLCHTWFKPCREVTLANGETVWGPSLTCRSDCEDFHSLWDECVAEIENDKIAKARFDSAMLQMRNAVRNEKLEKSTVPFRPYSCDTDADSDKVLIFCAALAWFQQGTHAVTFPPEL